MAKHVLVVDDNPENLVLLNRLLSSREHQVWMASSGKEALALLERDLPDLMLLDIMMPDMDGYELCRQLKTDQRTREIPVIFISALDQLPDKIEAFEAGGVDYIPKPFEMEEVLARVETHLTLRRLQKEREQQIAELDAFAHTVAHDLKNPLHVVLGYAEILGRLLAESKDPMIQESVATIIDTGRKMTTIIQELLLLASMRAVEDVELEPLRMGPLVEMATKRLKILMAERQAEIVVPETWPQALGYGPWIEEVWMNYIGNAVKYGGDPPWIQLGYTLLDAKESPTRDAFSTTENPQPRIKFWVHDNGQGLDQEEQAKLFTPFTRLHQARVEGHGLGLSIVQRILTRLGGEVGIESAPGQGSTFFFTLTSAEKTNGWR